MPHLIDFESCLKVAKEVVLEAGSNERFLANYKKSIQDKNVDIKDGNTGNLVTQTDRNLQEFIHSRLRKSFPSFKFMGEEEEEADGTSDLVFESELGDEPTWILDPIDGTTNFVHQFEFTVISLALSVDKTPVIGLIYCPVRGEMFEAVIGQGALLNGKPLRIDAGGLDLVQSLVITEFGATGKGCEDAVALRCAQINKLVKHGVHGIRMLGSAAFNLTRLATNSAQIYFEQGIHAWDIAAGTLIVREAGGIVTEITSACAHCDKFRLNGRSIVAAASPKIHSELMNLLLNK